MRILVLCFTIHLVLELHTSLVLTGHQIHLSFVLGMFLLSTNHTVYFSSFFILKHFILILSLHCHLLFHFGQIGSMPSLSLGFRLALFDSHRLFLGSCSVFLCFSHLVHAYLRLTRLFVCNMFVVPVALMDYIVCTFASLIDFFHSL